MQNKEIIGIINRASQDILKSENDRLLKLTNGEWGVFYMPELAFGYLLFTKLQSVFNIEFDDAFRVKREVQIINNDLTDIVINTNEAYHTAIEIKFDNTWNSYANDILKLSKIPSDKIHLRIFMGLKWFLPDNDDRRFVNDIYTYCTSNGINAKELIHEKMDTKVKNKASFALFTLWQVETK